jgi:eukaryotic-like serine/threonine-protein kinase
MMKENYGRYRIVGELGSGAMGVVYQAHDPQIDRMVALKVLRQDRVTSEAFVARFLKEARAIGRLSDPHIVTIYDVGEDHGTVYIAMEYLKGEPFNEVIRSGRLNMHESIDIARQVALTLDYAHRQGIVHRDIKPSNIILTEGNQVKLTDFGIARIEDTAASLQTQAGEILGTPVYMSPEQVKGEKVDGRSDLFSLGVILYEMVVGRRPFSGNNIAAIFNSITRDSPPVPVEVDPFIPKAVSDIVMKSLAKEPSNRFQIGRLMAEALASVSTEKAPVPPDEKKEAPVSTSWRIILPLIVAIGIGGYFFFHSQGREQSRPASEAIIQDAAVRVVPEHTSGPGPTIPRTLLKISSDPPGAQVFLDNGLQGMTPIDLPLALGKYELRLNLPGHLEWKAQVSLDTEGETPLNIALQHSE